MYYYKDMFTWVFVLGVRRKKKRPFILFVIRIIISTSEVFHSGISRAALPP